MRIIGLDIHRVFAEAVALEDGTYRRLGRVGMTRDHLVAFAATLRPADHVIVEATGKATAVLEILAPKVARVAVANPLQVHLIARARTKTDKIDARVLARLYAAGFLPKVWVPDERTLARRRQVTRRNPLAKSRVRPKAIVQSILHAHLVPRCPMPTSSAARGAPGCGPRCCRKTSVSQSSGTWATMTGRRKRRGRASATSPAWLWTMQR